MIAITIINPFSELLWLLTMLAFGSLPPMLLVAQRRHWHLPSRWWLVLFLLVTGYLVVLEITIYQGWQWRQADPYGTAETRAIPFWHLDSWGILVRHGAVILGVSSVITLLVRLTAPTPIPPESATQAEGDSLPGKSGTE